MSGLGGRRILLVEDEALVSMDIEDLLLGAGASVIGPAQTVALALMLLHDDRLDAAVLDMNLEGRSAMPVADALAALAIPFVVVTGAAKARAQAAVGTAPVLAKPYEPDELITTLVRLLEPREQPTDPASPSSSPRLHLASEC